ncbi:hypothetical protein [Bosea sp. TAB14]|uniref:hypothetical protein n=1 Tax=Bosea sp. TAB14 TaxID=3237481 RepID=UPI003F930F6C
MQGSSLPIDLRFLAAHLARAARSGTGLSPDQCERTADLLRQSAQEADDVVAQASLMPELEDELHAVAADLGAIHLAPEPSGYQAALKAQQTEIQRQLDGGGPVHVSRPGLAALAMPVGDTNVVVMPIAPRPRPFDGGDAA